MSGARETGAGAPRRAPASSYSFCVLHRGGRHDGDHRLVAERDGHGQVLAALLGGVQMLGDVGAFGTGWMASVRLPLHPRCGRRDVLLAAVLGVGGVLGDHGRLVDVEAAVAVVEPDQRKHPEDVGVLALQGVIGPRRVLAPLGGDREGVPAADELLDLFLGAGLLGQVERERVIGPGAVHIERDPRVGEALDVVEVQGGGVAAQARGGVRGGGDIRLRHHLVGDVQQLPLLPEGVEKAAEVVVGHGNSKWGWGGGGGHQAAGEWAAVGFGPRAARMPSHRLAAGAGRSNWSRRRAVRWSTMSSTDRGWL
ncbi:hypothetical protein SANTM175S_10387 [Streptomyces antimycoticus]